MSTLGSEKSQLKANESNLEAGYDIQQQRSIDDVVASFSQDLMASEGVDQILDMKVRLVNQVSHFDAFLIDCSSDPNLHRPLMKLAGLGIIGNSHF